jgi:acyl-coenzyme A thioesterase PaaI-like protein
VKDIGALVAAVPYARFLGLSFSIVEGELRGLLRHDPGHIGNPHVPAIHGGVIGALLETTSMMGLLAQSESETLPRIISITVEYHRTARPVDTWSRAEITRQGRRLATVRSMAWQDDPQSPVAVAGAHFLLSGELDPLR